MEAGEGYSILPMVLRGRYAVSGTKAGGYAGRVWRLPVLTQMLKLVKCADDAVVLS